MKLKISRMLAIRDLSRNVGRSRRSGSRRLSSHPLQFHDHYAGQIVGTFNGTTGEHGFLYSNGSFITIDVPGASVTDAVGIDNAGRIVGSFSGAKGVKHGFLATPLFAGTAGKANCYGQSVSALAKQYGGLNAAADDTRFPSISTLQSAILSYCDGSDQVASAR